MSLRLILTRHAKSSWGNPGLGDHDRPLNGRGRTSAEKIGAWLAARGDVPGAVLSSTSARTRETWARMAPAFADAPEPRWEGALYHAGPQTMLEVLQTAPPAARVLLLAHNPGIAEFAARIVTQPPDHPRFDDYPTAATTVIDFDVGAWADVDWRMGTPVAFAIPREL
ncbi:MAG: histidine phosphatase family protein [Rhodobacter sp.]|nr:histidine phosphatase family protein [Rhodobacter sp.]